MKELRPSRITEAREARAFSMGDLADLVGVTRQAISKYERGISKPTLDVLLAISRELNFPLEFFYKQEFETMARSSPLFFRSNINISKKEKTACRYNIKWASEIKRQLEDYVDFPNVGLFTIDVNYDELTFEDIENLALKIRNLWGIGDAPVGDLIGLLENNGIIVSQLPTHEKKFKGIDAFSCWRNGTPYILYNSKQKSAVRIRFSILHEVGHLIMHSSVSDEDSIKKSIIEFVDQQADRFAAAFLLPATSFPDDLHGSSLSAIKVAKEKWQVSMSAIIKRCETLDLLTENQIAYLKKQMTKNRWWYNEPLDDVIRLAGPELLRDAVLLLINNKVLSKEAFLNLTALATKDLKSICALPSDFFSEMEERQKPILKVITS